MSDTKREPMTPERMKQIRERAVRLATVWQDELTRVDVPALLDALEGAQASRDEWRKLAEDRMRLQNGLVDRAVSAENRIGAEQLARLAAEKERGEKLEAAAEREGALAARVAELERTVERERKRRGELHRTLNAERKLWEESIDGCIENQHRDDARVAAAEARVAELEVRIASVREKVLQDAARMMCEHCATGRPLANVHEFGWQHDDGGDGLWRCDAGPIHDLKRAPAAPDARDERIRELEGALDRDKTGLGSGLNRVREIAKGYGWISAGEWGSYDYTERTEETLRREVGWCLEAIEKAARETLEASGALAQSTLCPSPVMIAASPRAAERAATLERIRNAARIASNGGAVDDDTMPGDVEDWSSPPTLGAAPAGSSGESGCEQ